MVVSFDEARIAKFTGTVQCDDREVQVNSASNHDNVFQVHSGHRYQPVVHVISWLPNGKGWQECWSYEFRILKFYSCTHYRCTLLSEYKILLNVHASGLLHDRVISVASREKLCQLRMLSRPDQVTERLDSVTLNQLNAVQESQVAKFFVDHPPAPLTHTSPLL